MNCLRCGREIPDDQVFCTDCLAQMEKNPVPHNVVVVLPKRKDSSISRKITKKRIVSLDDQVKVLKRVNRGLAVLLTIATLVAVLLAFPAVEHYLEDNYAVGQNYTSIVIPPASSDG